MGLNVDELDPDSPDFEARVEAAQAAEDAEREGAGATPETPEGEGDGSAGDGEGNTPDAAAGAADTPTQGTAPPQETPEKPSKADGVLSKDGKKVLPWAVVHAAREEKRLEREARERAEAERDALRAENERLKSGKPDDPEGDPLDAAVEEAAADVPVVRELHQRLKAAEAKLNAQGDKPNEAPKAGADEPQGNPLQDDIDSIPLLATWQATDREKWSRAVALDNVMKDSPKWRGKPQIERFRHVTKQVADEFDIAFDDDDEPAAPQNTTSTPSKATAKAAIERATRQQPNTLSDFKNGAPADSTPRLDKLPLHQQVDRFSQMSDEEIDAHFARLG